MKILYSRGLAAVALAALALTAGPVISHGARHLTGGFDALGGSAVAQTTSTTTGRDTPSGAPVLRPAGTPPSQGPVSRTSDVNNVPFGRSFSFVIGTPSAQPAASLLSSCTGAGVAVVGLPDGSTPTINVPAANQILPLRVSQIVSTTGTGCVFTGLVR